MDVAGTILIIVVALFVALVLPYMLVNGLGEDESSHIPRDSTMKFKSEKSEQEKRWEENAR